MSDFDPYEKLDAMRAYWRQHYPRHFAGKRKLTLEGQCEVYACLYAGVPSFFIMHMFEISRSTVGYIAGCRDDDRKPTELEHDSGFIDPKTKLPIIYHEYIGGAAIKPHDPDRKQRYANVAAEFDRLGEAEFMRAYYNARVQRRLADVRAELRAKGEKIA